MTTPNKTQQERRDETRKTYDAVVKLATEAYDKAVTIAYNAFQVAIKPAVEAFDAIQEPALEAYEAEIARIDAEPESLITHEEAEARLGVRIKTD